MYEFEVGQRVTWRTGSWDGSQLVDVYILKRRRRWFRNQYLIEYGVKSTSWNTYHRTARWVYESKLI